MGHLQKQILILQKDPAFIEKVETVCPSYVVITPVQSPEDALESLSLIKYDLLLLQYDLLSCSKTLEVHTIEQLQPGRPKIALFQTPELSSLISAMKAGFMDVIWHFIELDEMALKIQDALFENRSVEIHHIHLSPMVESLARQSLNQKATLFQARKAFFHRFISLIRDKSNLSRYELASILEISPRTLQRYLSLSKNTKFSKMPQNP